MYRGFVSGTSVQNMVIFIFDNHQFCHQGDPLQSARRHPCVHNTCILSGSLLSSVIHQDNPVHSARRSPGILWLAHLPSLDCRPCPRLLLSLLWTLPQVIIFVFHLLIWPSLSLYYLWSLVLSSQTRPPVSGEEEWRPVRLRRSWRLWSRWRLRVFGGGRHSISATTPLKPRFLCALATSSNLQRSSCQLPASQTRRPPPPASPPSSPATTLQPPRGTIRALPGEELHGRQQLTKNCLAGLFQMLREIDISAFVKTFEVFKKFSVRAAGGWK